VKIEGDALANCTAHLAYLVHKSGRKTPIIIILLTVLWQFYSYFYGICSLHITSLMFKCMYVCQNLAQPPKNYKNKWLKRHTECGTWEERNTCIQAQCVDLSIKLLPTQTNTHQSIFVVDWGLVLAAQLGGCLGPHMHLLQLIPHN